ncbi:DUF4129 domain-containing protein [Ornithinibacillus bavariensis]|uniref:Protein-glutamine gamma-glutamyltransferase-like C-terminal domain-containing protein n=1 Tax=Ornithinibacillus bavariensis TaxID=545502 RepID=A0A919X720_9BACI|nr:DUF4129 domain-containing protein [Ornithinibacillus bavariensis]GIO26716.1 hypothetical protein J43TS3_13270 [Ornithinibacillus bavariensis]
MIDLDQANDKIEEILHRDEYLVYLKDNRSFLQKWWDSIKEWFGNLFQELFSSINPANGFATGIVVILLVVVVMLILVAGFFTIRNWRRKSKLQKHAPLYQKHEKDWGYEEHIAEANKREVAGDLQLATRHMFLALLLYFHNKEFVEARIWKTNWEYGQELRRTDKNLAESFQQLARIFDEVVYGEQKVERDAYMSYKETIGSLLAKQLNEEIGQG